MTGIVDEGSPSEKILDECKNHDLVVMGTLGRTGISKLLLGSVAERVVRFAHAARSCCEGKIGGKTMTLVCEVMTSNPIVAELPGRREDMLRTMVKHNLTGMPVIRKSDGSLAGLVTRNDIFDKPEEDQIALVMNRTPDMISPSSTVEMAAEIMIKKKIHHLPVVDDSKLIRY